MTPIEAALLASAITAVASLGVTWFGDWLRRRDSARTRKLTAYQDVLSLSATVRRKALIFGGAMLAIRTGKGSGEDVLDRLEWWATDLDSLRDATNRLWLEGSAEAVATANQIFGLCAGLAEIAIQPQDAAQDERWRAEVGRLARLRADFASLARRDLKQTEITILELGGELENDPLPKIE